jgi:hypothetical protein
MKSLEEIDCDEDLWNELRNISNNGWGQLESQLTFVYQTKSKRITIDDIDTALWDKFESADNIVVEQVTPEEKEHNMRYFLASVTIYNSGI